MINLTQQRYYPALRTRTAELKGLRLLTRERKEQIAPILTLGKWPRAEDLDPAMQNAITSMDGLPFFVDLTNEINSLSPLINHLRMPQNGYGNWISFLSTYQQAGAKILPIVQITPPTLTQDVVRQAQQLERQFGYLAFRIKNYGSDIQFVIDALSSLHSTQSAIVFIDSEYITDSYPAVFSANIHTINAIRAQVPTANISTLATSFPVSTISNLQLIGDLQTGTIEIKERTLHQQLGAYRTVGYGDYGSVHAVIYDTNPAVMRRGAPRIDYPLWDQWLISRAPNAYDLQQGYQQAAQYITQQAPFWGIDISNSDIWGDQMIAQTAQGLNPVGTAPAPWITVRVNIHISRQIDLTAIHINPPQNNDEDNDYQ